MWIGLSDLTEHDLVELEKQNKEKEAFAIALIHYPSDALQAALAVSPYNSDKALWIAQFWVNDPYVQAHKAKLLIDSSQLLPTKARLAAIAMKIADDTYAAPKDRLAAVRLCSDLQGWTGAGSKDIEINKNQSVTNKVMEIPMASSFQTWEAIAEKQQSSLTTTYSVVPENEK